MAEKDSLLTIKDWIESFWQFQEEDINFFKEGDLKEKILKPREFLAHIRERMQERRVFYKLFKHVVWGDLTPDEVAWIQAKLDEILARETAITEAINKILEILSELFLEEDQKEIKEMKESGALIPEEKIIFH